MKRRRRKRSTRRRGVQHIGNILAELLNDIEEDEVENVTPSDPVHVRLPASSPETAGQSTFSFYQPAEV